MGVHLQRYTPAFHDIGKALHAWRRLNQFQIQRNWSRGKFRLDRVSSLDNWMWCLHHEWPAFRNVYLDILEECGMQRQSCDDRLAALEEATRAHRNGLIELWNRRVMAADERRQRCPETLQRQQESTLQCFNRRAMA